MLNSINHAAKPVSFKAFTVENTHEFFIRKFNKTHRLFNKIDGIETSDISKRTSESFSPEFFTVNVIPLKYRNVSSKNDALRIESKLATILENEGAKIETNINGPKMETSIDKTEAEFPFVKKINSLRKYENFQLT